jgi:hypothetical protein
VSAELVVLRREFPVEVRRVARANALNWLEVPVGDVTPICHCGCCRKCTEHNEMKAAA